MTIPLEQTRYPGIFKRTGLTKVSYVAIVRVGSKQRKRSFDSLTAARTWRTERLAEVAGGTYVEPSKLTLGAWMQEVIDLERGNLQPNTIRAYIACRARLRALHEIPLQKLDLLTVDRWKQTALTSATPYAPGTVHATLTFLKKAMLKAVTYGKLPRDPLTGMKKPDLSPNIDNQVTLDELAALRYEWRDDPLLAFWEVLVQTGARIGEVTAAKLEDVDLERGIWSVRWTMTLTEDAKVAIRSGAKTEEGERDIPLSERLILLVQQHRRSIRKRMLKERGWNPLGLLFPSDHGGFTDRRALQDQLDVYCHTARVRRITFHGFRHGLATSAVNASIPATDVQHLLGHADVATTLRIYVRSDATSQKTASNRITDILFSGDRCQIIAKQDEEESESAMESGSSGS